MKLIMVHFYDDDSSRYTTRLVAMIEEVVQECAEMYSLPEDDTIYFELEVVE